MMWLFEKVQVQTQTVEKQFEIIRSLIRYNFARIFLCYVIIPSFNNYHMRMRIRIRKPATDNFHFLLSLLIEI